MRNWRIPQSIQLMFEARARLKGLQGWNRIMARNEWFQREALRFLSNLRPPSSVLRPPTSDLRPPALFAYSYAARDLFRWARAQGWRTVLGQIDPAVTEERLVERLHQRQSELSSDWQAAPLKYWEQWHEECQLADRIVVNSEWSRKALEKEGISAGKIRVVPLAYAPPPEAAGFRREYPAQFTSERPLRILFLGQINLRKGIGPLLEAAEMLRGEPVEFHIVGPVLVTVPEKWRRHPQIRWLGPVPRGAVAEHYRAADVFLFPTFSDGFGMTQLEAQAWQLPIVASQFCGDVVRDGVNGLRLTEVNAGGIAQAVRRFLASPEQLAAMSRASGVGAEFSLSGIAATLESVLD